MLEEELFEVLGDLDWILEAAPSSSAAVVAFQQPDHVNEKNSNGSNGVAIHKDISHSNNGGAIHRDAPRLKNGLLVNDVTVNRTDIPDAKRSRMLGMQHQPIEGCPPHPGGVGNIHDHPSSARVLDGNHSVKALLDEGGDGYVVCETAPEATEREANDLKRKVQDLTSTQPQATCPVPVSWPPPMQVVTIGQPHGIAEKMLMTALPISEASSSGRRTEMTSLTALPASPSPPAIYSAISSSDIRASPPVIYSAISSSDGAKQMGAVPWFSSATRARQSAMISQEERKKRARIHARKARQRKKESLEQLERERRELEEMKPSLERDQERDRKQRVLLTETLRRTLHMWHSNERDKTAWLEVVADDITVTLPVTPYRYFAPSQVGATQPQRRTMRGLDALLTDAASLSLLCKAITPERMRFPVQQLVRVIDDSVVVSDPNSRKHLEKQTEGWQERQSCDESKASAPLRLFCSWECRATVSFNAKRASAAECKTAAMTSEKKTSAVTKNDIMSSDISGLGCAQKRMLVCTFHPNLGPTGQPLVTSLDVHFNTLAWRRSLERVFQAKLLDTPNTPEKALEQTAEPRLITGALPPFAIIHANDAFFKIYRTLVKSPGTVLGQHLCDVYDSTKHEYLKKIATAVSNTKTPEVLPKKADLRGGGKPSCSSHPDLPLPFQALPIAKPSIKLEAEESSASSDAILWIYSCTEVEVAPQTSLLQPSLCSIIGKIAAMIEEKRTPMDSFRATVERYLKPVMMKENKVEEITAMTIVWKILTAARDENQVTMKPVKKEPGLSDDAAECSSKKQVSPSNGAKKQSLADEIRACIEVFFLKARHSGMHARFLEYLQSGNRESCDVANQFLWASWAAHESHDVIHWLNEGHKAINDKDFLKALEIYDKVVAADPNFAEGWNWRSTSEYYLGRFAAAIIDADKVISIEPSHFGAWCGKGFCLMDLKRYAEACSCFQAALKINPRLAHTGITKKIEICRQAIKTCVL